MTKQVNVRLDAVSLAMLEELKKLYDTNSTTDTIKLALVGACEQLGVNTHDIIIEAFSNSEAD